MSLPNSAVIFSEGDSQHPMDCIFDAPMKSNNLVEAFGLCGKTGDVVTFGASFNRIFSGFEPFLPNKFRYIWELTGKA